MKKINYPTRCRIIDVVGTGHKVGPYTAATPDGSKPHIGKEGLAELIESSSPFDFIDHDVRITLDDGTILMGYQCWWEPIEDNNTDQGGDR